MNTSTIIDVIRHGEPVGGRKYRGQIDDPLSAKGWAQMRAAVGEYAGWQQIVSSPLLRCAEFATELAHKNAIPLTKDARLKEVRFGDWEGKTSAEITATEPDLLFNFKRNPSAYRPANAETIADFYQRVSSAWDALVQQYTGQHVLVVAHAGVIRMLLAHVLSMPAEQGYRIQVASAAVSRFAITQRNGLSHSELIFHDGILKA
ncbi:MAG: alpha-ribazole phosphatase family protein [Sulfuriferula sp.]|nr:alpha-ribazole phosphatase family protein [Sulfuriferula sp.]